MQWLRRSFVAGFFVTVPLFISVAALIWIFNVVDGATTPLYDRLIGRRIPGLGVGVCQTLALIPGVSRSGATIIGGMALGLDRAAAAEFSFFLAMPTMMAAFAHDLVDARHELGAARVEEIAVGFVMAFIASALVVRPFLAYVRRNGFAPFAWYRIGLGLVMLIAIYAMAAA